MISRSIELPYEHRVFFTKGAFSPENETLKDCLLENRPPHRTGPVRAILALDEAILANGSLISSIEAYFAHHGESITLAAPPRILPGGEPAKNDWSQVEQLWADIHDHGICRHSYVIALGGGAILDLVGFAAATAHRGIRHIRMPSTTLSQGDGGVGVKNGVNYFGKKNWVGTFSVPHAIINDLHLLRTLPPRVSRMGLIEAIKVALIRDGAFFEAMEDRLQSLADLEEDALDFVVRRSAELHMNHIALGGDPFELGSARPLDFGHWSAHKMEQLSDFSLGHGEAVAVGIAVDLLYARDQGLLTPADAERILYLIEKIGFTLYHPALHQKQENGEFAVLRGLEEFREHLGGELTITLVTGIGTAIEVHEMDSERLPSIFDELKERSKISSPSSLEAVLR
ncbi:MAG: 3-dehydroquinate synthase [Verrucomicrobiota bacterium]